MNPPVFTNYGLDFTSLSERDTTDMIVLHHTGNPVDDDLSAEQIHASHLAKDWRGGGVTAIPFFCKEKDYDRAD